MSNDNCFGLFGLLTDDKRQDGTSKCENSDGFNGCIACGTKRVKYKCPACEAKSCSLECCTTHKIELNCTGIRNRIRFKRMSDYDQKQFIDGTNYFFLEDTDRTIDMMRRDKKQIVKSMEVLPPWLKKLLYESKMRGIRLKLLPAGFQRRIKNKTTFMYHEKMIFWDLEWVFANCSKEGSSEPLIITDHRIPENLTFAKIMERYVKPQKQEHWNKTFEVYQSVGFKGISVLLKLEFQKYVEIDLTSTINDALKSKTIVEFPTFYVILKDSKHSFDIIEEDEVMEAERELQQRVFKKLKANEESTSDIRDVPGVYGPLPEKEYQ